MKTISNNNTARTAAIVNISVEKLFGYFNYEISLESDKVTDVSRLFILYGDNGSGKTTILKLLYHILSPAFRRAHRTFIARQKFKKFAVLLSNGICIKAERNGSSLEGNYDLSIIKDNNKIFSIALKVSENNTIKVSGKQEKLLREYSQHLSDLNLQIYFLLCILFQIYQI